MRATASTAAKWFGPITACGASVSVVIQNRMANVLTLRISPAKLAKLDKLAAGSGRDRSGYVRSLIDTALERPQRTARHKFASADLLGALSIGNGPATNENTRRIIRERLKVRREAPR